MQFPTALVLIRRTSRGLLSVMHLKASVLERDGLLGSLIATGKLFEFFLAKIIGFVAMNWPALGFGFEFFLHAQFIRAAPEVHIWFHSDLPFFPFEFLIPALSPNRFSD